MSRLDFFIGVYPGLDDARLSHMERTLIRFLDGEVLSDRRQTPVDAAARLADLIKHPHQHHEAAE